MCNYLCPNDLQALLPRHLLILEPLNSTILNLSFEGVKVNRLDRWQLLKRMQNDFWKRCNGEYLHTLQQRFKWHKTFTNIEIGTLVLNKENNRQPLQQELARIVDVHPGLTSVNHVIFLVNLFLLLALCFTSLLKFTRDLKTVFSVGGMFVQFKLSQPANNAPNWSQMHESIILFHA